MKRKLFTGTGIALLLLTGAFLYSNTDASHTPGGSQQEMFIPAYFYPDWWNSDSLWNQAIAAAPTVGTMVMNPNSGPGSSQNPDYVQVVNDAQAVGIRILGYVHTSYGVRDANVVKGEIDDYKAWYGVDGIFLDEVSTSPADLPYYQDLADYIRATSGTYVALNPGTVPDEGYVQLADATSVFEGTYSNYRNWVSPSWFQNYPPEKFINLVHKANRRNKVTKSINWAWDNHNAGHVYVTNDVLPNPWDTLVKWWSAALNEIDGNFTQGCLDPQHALVPAYFYPDWWNPNSPWNQAIAGAPTNEDMIMNPANGPGSSQNPDYVQVVNDAQAAGIRVIGYVWTDYGNKDPNVVKGEIDDYKAWYGVDGIFLDGASTDPALISYYQDLADYIRATSGTHVILNPGWIPDEGYMAVADVVNVFASTYSNYLTFSTPAWFSNYSNDRFSSFIFDAPTSADMDNALNLANNTHNTGRVYVTDDALPNPWDSLPTYWNNELTEMDNACF